MQFRFDVPMIPPSPNELRRKYRNPHVYKKLRLSWELALMVAPGSAVRLAGIRKMAVAHDRIGVFIRIEHTTPYDPDNLTGSVKVVLDAMKNLRFLKDDDHAHIDLHVTQTVQKNREAMTFVVLEGL
jgi:hypothetical protein